jgi:hypothetical protein
MMTVGWKMMRKRMRRKRSEFEKALPFHASRMYRSRTTHRSLDHQPLHFWRGEKILQNL